MRLVLASDNGGKLREIAALVSPLGYELVPQSQFGLRTPPETGATFLDNALLKARFAAEHTGCAALADDSGIEVDALGGRPGVYSARYAGEDAGDQENLWKMLRELDGLPLERRTARYRCVIALVHGKGDPRPVIAEGSWEGRILEAPRGMGGFGYDPIFLPEGASRSAAELAPEEKNALSHRAAALRALLGALSKLEASVAS